MKSEGMCKIEESKLDMTKSKYCCRDICPYDINGHENKTMCSNLVCGQDGKFYLGMCALSKCGKTVSYLYLDHSWLQQKRLICLFTSRKNNAMVYVIIVGINPQQHWLSLISTKITLLDNT